VFFFLTDAGEKSHSERERMKARKLKFIQIIYMSLIINFFVWDASGTEVSVKGFRAGVPRRYESTVGEAPSVREE